MLVLALGLFLGNVFTRGLSMSLSSVVAAREVPEDVAFINHSWPVQDKLDANRKQLLALRQAPNRPIMRFAGLGRKETPTDLTVLSREIEAHAAEVMRGYVPYAQKLPFTSYRGGVPKLPVLFPHFNYDYPVLVETRSKLQEVLSWAKISHDANLSESSTRLPYWVFCKPGPQLWNHSLLVFAANMISEKEEVLTLQQGLFLMFLYPASVKDTTLLLRDENSPHKAWLLSTSDLQGVRSDIPCDQVLIPITPKA